MSAVGESWRQERRIVTALVAEIAGSASLSDGLDPEDAHDLIGGAVDVMIREIEALDGTVKEVSGYAVTAIFGAPIAHEDDPVRGVLCGVRIVDAITAYAAASDERQMPGSLAVCIGVDSGRVVAGHVAAGSRVEFGATGPVLETAGRLREYALPNSVLVGQETRDFVGDAFIWSDEATYGLARRSPPLAASTALAFAPARRLEHRSPALPLVGRVEEQAALRHSVNELGDGRGSVIVIVGEPGTGKTRLVDELHSLLPDLPPGNWLEATAASHSQSTPFSVYRSMSLRLVGLTDTAHRIEYREGLRAFAAASPPDIASSVLNLLKTLGDVDWREPQRPREASDPEGTRERIFDAIRRLIESISREGPTVMILEDLHWMDPTSVALTHIVADICLSEPLLMVITTRQDNAAQDEVRLVGERVADRLRTLNLRPLSRDEDRSLLTAKLDGLTLPRDLEEQVLRTADGNPFFLLEQVRALLGNEAPGAGSIGLRGAAAHAVTLAPTVERTLMARIDRLSTDDRLTLMAAAVLGQDFDALTLEELIDGDTTASLERLVESEFLVHQRPVDPTWTWFRFQHALVRQAAYASLPRKERRSLHLRAADTLEAAFAERLNDIAANLGRHLLEAEDTERAIPYLLRAARTAATTFSNEEASALAHDALSLLNPHLSDESRGMAVELLRIAIAADRHIARYDSALAAQERLIALLPKADALARAAELRSTAQILAEAHRYDEALTALDKAEASLGNGPLDADGFGIWLKTNIARGEIYYWLADDGALAELVERIRPVVDERATVEQLLAYRVLVRSALLRRDRHVVSDEALTIDNEIYSVAIRSEDAEKRAWARFQHGFTLMWHRDLAEAAALFGECLDDAARIGSALHRARALTYLMVTARLDGDVEAAAALTGPVQDSARLGGLIEYSAMASATAAWIAYRRDDSSTVLAEGHQALALWATTPTRYTFDWMSCLPLLAVALDERDLGRAEHWVRVLLAPDQQPLPASVDELLRSGLTAAASRRDSAAYAALEAAVQEARSLKYL